jgi:hypothetical protein
MKILVIDQPPTAAVFPPEQAAAVNLSDFTVSFDRQIYHHTSAAGHHNTNI